VPQPHQVDRGPSAVVLGRHLPDPSPVSALLGRLEGFFVPDAGRGTGGLDARETRLRYLHMVGVIAAASVLMFAPSMVVAGVPPERRLAFLLAVVGAALVISASLLVPRPGSRLALVGATADALVIAGLGLLLEGYYHEIALLFALVARLAPAAGALGTVRALAVAGVQVNCALGLFNLIPIPPLDGSWVLMRFLPLRHILMVHRFRFAGLALVAVLLAVPAFAGAVFEGPLAAVVSLCFAAVGLPADGGLS